MLAPARRGACAIHQLARAGPSRTVTRTLSSTQAASEPNKDSPIDSPLPPSQSLPAQAQSQTARQTAAAAAPTPAASLEPLSYHVHRTPSQQLPIYQKRKRGGTLLQTRVQKVTGRVEDLKHALQKELQIPEGKIIVNPTNRHIIVKGWVKKDIAAYLEKQRF